MKKIENLENLAVQAAQCQRMVWQGHDEKDKALCLKGAVGLYTILTEEEHSKIMVSARYMQEAYWLSDDAEEYQKFDSELEDRAYGLAGLCLHRSRRKLGLETDSVQYTVNWWKAYRHEDKEALVENLVKEQALQMCLKENLNVAKKCTEILLEAAAEHKKKDWVAVDKKLEEYFTIYLSSVLKE